MSRRIVRLAVAGISLGMVVMILAVAIVTGFKQEIESKVNGFAAHLQVVNYDSNQSFETQPVSTRQPFLSKLKEMPGVKHVQQFATKPGMIKAGDEIQGVVLKGVAADFDWTFFQKSCVEGLPIKLDSARTDEVWISEQFVITSYSIHYTKLYEGMKPGCVKAEDGFSPRLDFCSQNGQRLIFHGL